MSNLKHGPLSPATRVIAAHDPPHAHQMPVALPIVQSSTFVIDAALDAAMAAGDWRSEYLYSRHANPTVDALARRLAELHGGADAVAFASGMAAVSAVLVGLTAPGQRVVADQALYGATATFLTTYLSAMGRKVALIDLADAATRAAHVRPLASDPAPPLVYGETLSNPLCRVLDLPVIAAEMAAVGGTFVVDNTFANPLVCRPLAHGAHVVIESLSKSIAGHSDVHGGAVVTDAARGAKVWHAMIHLGGCLDPHAAYLIWRGLKTLAMRTDTARANAGALARALAHTPGVRRVYRAEDAPWLAHAGAMLAFVVEGGNAAAHRVLDALRVVAPATSLGGVESLASLPYNTSHRTPEAQAQAGLLPGTVRLSVGCEAEADLIADLAQAIAASQSG